MPELKYIMTREVEVISPDATIADAALGLAKLDVGAMPVCEWERLVGMLTDAIWSSKS